MIDETGKQIGVMRTEEALAVAKERGLDLIQITEKVEPPVCKMGDYGKYIYQQEKKTRKGRKHERGELKEIRLTFAISANDLATRAGQAKKFLLRGNKVKVVLRLRGREKALEGYAKEKIQKFLWIIEQSFAVKTERNLKKEPRGLTMIITKA